MPGDFCSGSVGWGVKIRGAGGAQVFGRLRVEAGMSAPASQRRSFSFRRRDEPGKKLGAGARAALWIGAGVAVVNLGSAIGDDRGARKSQERKARMDLRSIDDAAGTFFGENGRVPTIAELIGVDGQGWLAGYEGEDEVKDPWDRPYVLRATSADSWVVVCSGPDRTFGTEDDIWTQKLSR
jgi:hypothetical protein